MAAAVSRMHSRVESNKPIARSPTQPARHLTNVLHPAWTAITRGRISHGPPYSGGD